MPSRRARSGNYAIYRTWANKLAEAALLPVYLARRRRKVDAADGDADEANEEGEVLEADAELQKRRKTEDAVAAMNVYEDVRMKSDGGAFLVGPCNGEDPEYGNEDYDEYNVENDDGHYEERFEDEEDNNNDDNYPAPAEATGFSNYMFSWPFGHKCDRSHFFRFFPLFQVFTKVSYFAKFISINDL